MHDIPGRIADVLLEMEANLRSRGQWESEPPHDSDLSSPEPFCFDTLRFEQWLQWVFLPRMKHILERQQPLPASSGIYVYAHECLPRTGAAAALLTLIKRFDDLIAIQSGARLH